MKEITIRVCDEAEIVLKTYSVKAKGFKSAVKIVSKLYRNEFPFSGILIYK